MKIKLLISTIIILAVFPFYGQSSSELIVKDSTKIRISGNSVYRAHEEVYMKNDSAQWSSIRYTKIIVLNVLFKTSKSEILSKSFNELNKLSALLKNNPEIGLKINGHTDKIGNSKRNLKLSKRRAKAIKVYLMKNGVKSNRIATNGFGDKFPICQSPCEKNRRVEFNFVIPDNLPVNNWHLIK